MFDRCSIEGGWVEREFTLSLDGWRMVDNGFGKKLGGLLEDDWGMTGWMWVDVCGCGCMWMYMDGNLCGRI